MNLKDLIDQWLKDNGYINNWWLRMGTFDYQTNEVLNWEIRHHQTHYHYYVRNDNVECGCEYPESIEAADPLFFDKLKKLIDNPESYTCNRLERPIPHPWIF